MRYLTLVVLLVFSYFCSSQDLLNGRHSSYHTFIYKINTSEAEEINHAKKWIVDSTFFHTLVDSYPTDSVYHEELSTGHYLKVYAKGSELQLDYSSVQDFDVQVLNNSTDLNVKVFDFQGNVISDAKVKVKGRRLFFDQKTRTYRIKKSNRRGLLSVSHDGHTAFYELSRQLNNSLARRVFRKTVYGSPLKLVWRPVKFIIHIPVDGVKSVLWRYPTGSIGKITYHSERLFHTVACWFDDYHCDWYGDDWKFREKHKGYMAFSKPKYMPGDTVRFKAFITKRKGKPISEPVWATIYAYPESIDLGKVEPYTNGGFAHEFLLSDTLGLKLDKSYSVYLSDEHDRTFISNDFQYEEYELGKIKMELKVADKVQFRGETASIEVKGTDENDLNLLDARLEILITPTSLKDYFEDHLFLSDTLGYFTKDLEPHGITKIEISDTIFPKANFAYKVHVSLLTSDNERLVETEYLSFYEHQEFIGYELINDSIKISYKVNGEMGQRLVDVVSYDRYLNPIDTVTVDLPNHILVNPFAYRYSVYDMGELKSAIDLSDEESLLSFQAQRTPESLVIQSSNPRKIPFVYYLYKTNNEVDRGYGTELNIKKRTLTNENFYLAMQYLWGGEVIDYNYEIALDKNKLQVNISAPAVVFPGQSVELTVDVKDGKGKPVADVDILAHGLTSKFKAHPEDVPKYASGKKERQLINTFDLDVAPHYQDSRPYDYDRWNPLMALDSIEYFKFLYPSDLYRFEYTPKDSTTQFSPFVVKDGVLQSIGVVYVDQIPVYFSWSTDEPYSFKVDSGYHQVQIRTEANEYFLDSIYFRHQQKLIFSFDHDELPQTVRKYERGPEITDRERSNLSRYVMPYRYSFQDRFGFIQQGDRYFSVRPGAYSHIAGPIHSRKVNFGVYGDFTQPYSFEPFFEYELTSGLIKMRSQNEKALVPRRFVKPARSELSDLILTKESLWDDWQQELKRRRTQSRKYSNPRTTRSNQGQLIVKVLEDSAEAVLNTLLFKHDDSGFLRVYPGQNSHFHALRQGYYRLIYLSRNGSYAVNDSIEIRTRGTNYLRLPLKVQSQDSFSLKLNQLMDSYFEEQSFHPLNKEAKEELFRTYQQQYQYFGPGQVISGFVYSIDGEALPGANVQVKGTTFGTVTDMDGHYAIRVPYENQKLYISFIGFSGKEVSIDSESSSVILEYDEQHLDEVIVIGYGVAKKRSLTASTSTVLQGRVAGVSIVDDSTKPITIRGINSLSGNSNPLIILNGIPYLGDLSELDANSIDEMKVMKSVELTALYGARAADGVVFISTDGALKTDPLANIKGAELTNDFVAAVDQSSAIRNNFSDEAFWEPMLQTDENGQVKFEVTFPDDITQWETFVYAMNGHKQTGSGGNRIKSFKPLSAQLSLPRFLVAGDSTGAIGKALNYGLDSINISTVFEVNDQEVWRKNKSLIHSIIDTLTITQQSGDSIKVKYFLTRGDGYFDGEERTLEVFPVGIKKSTGQYAALYGDTTVTWIFPDSLGPVRVYANSRSMELLRQKINYLIDYPYSCNEQLASRLIALVVSRKLNDDLDIRKARDGKIRRIIKKLENNQNSQGLWGWWNNSSTSLWISTHVIEALTLAMSDGYKVGLNNSVIAEEAAWNLTAKKPGSDLVDWLYMAQMLNLSLDRKHFVKGMDNVSLDIRSRLRLEWIKAELGLPTDSLWLTSILTRDQLGRLFVADTSSNFSFFSDRSVEFTAMALRLLALDSTGSYDTGPMEDYLIDKMSGPWYTNTYTISKVLAVLSTSLSDKSREMEASLKINGAERGENLPFEALIDPGAVEVSKTGLMPVYLGAQQTYWERRPVVDTTSFGVSTTLESGKSILKAGVSETLIARVNVLRDAEYVMIEVPIPAGCSYATKSNYYPGEIHREYFKEKVSIFCQKLGKGTHEFRVELLPRYRGEYTLNPAKAELMYFPVFYGHEGVKRVVID